MLDTSAAVKLFAPEAGSDAIMDLFASGAEFVAPDIFPLELASALLRKERRREVTAGTAQRALRDLSLAEIALVPHAPMLDAATALASEQRHGAYDCLFLLTARSQGIPVVTSDVPMADLARRIGVPLWVAPA